MEETERLNPYVRFFSTYIAGDNTQSAPLARQLVIMNASSFVGRLFPGLILHLCSVKLMITMGCGCGAILILTMIAIHNVASVVTIGVFYGFFAGGSEFPFLFFLVSASRTE